VISDISEDCHLQGFKGEGHRPFTLEHEDDTFLQDVWSHLPSDENHIPEDQNPGKWMCVG